MVSINGLIISHHLTANTGKIIYTYYLLSEIFTRVYCHLSAIDTFATFLSPDEGRFSPLKMNGHLFLPIVTCDANKGSRAL